MAQGLMEVLQQHHADSWGWSLACCRWQPSLAEDCLQEAYLRVLDGRAIFGGRSSEKTWFFGVVRRVAMELQRAQSRQGQLVRLHEARNADGGEGAVLDEGALAADESNRALQRALLGLSERQREVLHMVFYAELTLEEAAAVLGLSIGSARTHYHRGKQRLLQLLEQDDD